ncbi:MAG: MBOAT family protein [Duncaniella sp.]|nr:MBOAT family protein [Duncaniella sp.]
MSQISDYVESFLERLNIDISKVTDLLVYDPANPLLFNTGLFFVLFVGFLIVYRIFRSLKVLKMLFVILFSLYFYYKSSGVYCLILLGVAVSDFLLGLFLQWAREGNRRFLMRLTVAVNVLTNVGMLAYFKYFNLLIDSVNKLFTTEFDTLELILPAGISFFTFRSISYMVDIYRGQIDACRRPLDYLFFLTFFPPLLAGPVVRAKDMLPQIAANPVATREMTSEGIWLIIVGLIKKMVIADYISGNFVDRVFDNPALYSGFENLMASFGFTIQLYCDFSGYSDMAIGIALLLGYRFADNFNSPFKAQNPTEFWHRWHISLSTWLRDYVYIPLGGNRCSKPRAYFNQFATMVIGGFWHGASWMYVIWGGAHGILLVAHKSLRGILPDEKDTREEICEDGTIRTRPTLGARIMASPFTKGFNILVTFCFVAATFMLFRARTMEDVGMMWHQIFTNFHLSVAPQFLTGYLAIVCAMLFGYLVHISPSFLTGAVQRWFMKSPLLIQAILLAIALLIVIQVRSSDLVPFLYLQY